MTALDPKLDPATIGISFVDILFALAVGQVLDPVKNWGEDPHLNPLTLPVAAQLAVVLVLTLTSWVGYHSSTNRPRFRLGFFNLELVKFSLDVAMVVVYFLAAAFAARRNPSLRSEALLITLAFGLYGLWDLAGAIQKSGTDNKYRDAWNKVAQDPTRPDVVEPWTPTNKVRIAITFAGLLGSAGLLLATLVISALNRPTRLVVVIADAGIILGLVAYRYAKDHAPATANS
jgi:hypothetical protein